MRRRPKRLFEAPQLFASGPGRAVVADVDTVDDREGGGADERDAGGQGVLVTARRAHRRQLADLLEERPADPGVAAMAGRLARSLAVRHRRADRDAAAGGGPLDPVPFHHRSDELDLDRTLEALVEHSRPEDTDLVVRERRRARTATVLVVDVSGSMRGEKAAIAAATTAAVAAGLRHDVDQFALVAFWSDAAVINPLGSWLTPAVLLDRLLRVPARGLTNVGFGLQVAATELAHSTARHRRLVLLSDAVHNAGPDPRPIARRLPTLHVLLEVDGEHDEALGRDLARWGRGGMAPVRTHRDVAPALERLLAR